MKKLLTTTVLILASLNSFAQTSGGQKKLAVIVGIDEVKLLTSGTKDALIKNIKFECRVEREGELLTPIECKDNYDTYLKTVICTTVCSKGKSALINRYGLID